MPCHLTLMACSPGKKILANYVSKILYHQTLPYIFSFRRLEVEFLEVWYFQGEISVLSGFAALRALLLGGLAVMIRCAWAKAAKFVARRGQL